MKISILCSSKNHPIRPKVMEWYEKNKKKYNITILDKKKDLLGGDVLFLVSCHELILESDRKKYKKTLVLHASDLPRGRGWSPHIWELYNGASFITLSLLEAECKVDSGKIWKKMKIPISKDCLYDEINEKLFEAEIKLINFAIENFHTVTPRAQSLNIKETYHRRRTPEDSILDTEKTISEQFDLLRVCDPERYPAYFKMNGFEYTLKVMKVMKDE